MERRTSWAKSFREAGVALAVSALATAALLAGAATWNAAEPMTERSQPAPAFDRDRGTDSEPPGSPASTPAKGNGQDDGVVHPPRDPQRFYRKPPRVLRPHTHLVAARGRPYR